MVAKELKMEYVVPGPNFAPAASKFVQWFSTSVNDYDESAEREWEDVWRAKWREEEERQWRDIETIGTEHAVLKWSVDQWETPLEIKRQWLLETEYVVEDVVEDEWDMVSNQSNSTEEWEEI
jgi:hypothetical protein